MRASPAKTDSTSWDDRSPCVRSSTGAVLIAAAALGVASGCVGQGAARPEAAGARDDVIAGARHDFRHSRGVPPAFVRCFLPGLRQALDGPALDRLAATARDRGRPAAARALNRLAVPIGDRCGERWYVPQLTGAAGGLG
jgi:hypothetical protein